MRLVIDKAVSRLEIFAEGDEIKRILGGNPKEDGQRIKVAEIDNPILMTDPFKIGKFDSVTRDILFQLYQSFPRITEYDGVECFWDPKIYPTVWCPSIDTIFFATAIREIMEITPLVNAICGSKPVKTAIDVGCGSGFLGKYVMKKQANFETPLQKLHFLDIDPNAIRCAMDNTEKERNQTFISYSLNRDMDKLEIESAYDFVICNPPYIPRPKLVSANPYEGLVLIKEILREARNILSPTGILLLNFSSLCEKEFQQWTAENDIDYEIMAREKVPLKVLPVISGKTQKSRKWLEYLARKSKNGLEIDEKETSGYRYWHTINIARIKGSSLGG